MESIDLRPHDRAATTTAGAPPSLGREALVVGPDDWGIRDASDRLRAAGFEVHRCSDSAEAPFPCRALTGAGCPLDRHPISVVLDARARAAGQMTLSEFGVVCGVRAGIPIVAAGLSGKRFAQWATEVPADGDLVATIEQATTVPR